MLIYFVKHSIPELYNAVIEISKYMDKSNISHYKAPIHPINYLIDTRNTGAP